MSGTPFCVKKRKALLRDCRGGHSWGNHGAGHRGSRNVKSEAEAGWDNVCKDFS